MFRLNTDQNSPFWILHCEMNFRQKVSAKAKLLLDTGADIGLLPRWILPEKVLQYLEPDETYIKGIGEEKVPSIGRLSVTLSRGEKKLEDIRFSVVDHDVPAIIGLNFLRHPSVRKHSICHQKDLLGMTLKDNTEFVLKLDSTRELRPEKLKVVEEDGNVNLTRFSDLNQKLKYIKTELGIDLKHSNASELEEFCNLVLKYEKIFGPETGNFPGEVEFLTRGPPRAARQRPVPSHYEEAVDTKIKEMLEQGIIEECQNSRGWLSTILVTPKPNGDPRICMDFKQTINKCLI